MSTLSHRRSSNPDSAVNKTIKQDKQGAEPTSLSLMTETDIVALSSQPTDTHCVRKIKDRRNLPLKHTQAIKSTLPFPILLLSLHFFFLFLGMDDSKICYNLLKGLLLNFFL